MVFNTCIGGTATETNNLEKLHENATGNGNDGQNRYYYLLQAFGDPKFTLSKESARKNGIKAEFTPLGWVFQNKSDAEEVAERWTDGKRVCKAVPWYDEYSSLLDTIWKGTKREAKLAQKKLNLSIADEKANKKKQAIELQCYSHGLHHSWLYAETLPDDMSEEDKKTHAYFKSLWDETSELKEQIALRDADIRREREDVDHLTVEDSIVEQLNKKHAFVHTDSAYILSEKPHAFMPE